MYIRRTTIKPKRGAEPYFTYRLVESIRIGQQVRQRTLVNLGRHFEVPQEQWPALAQRIEQQLSGQSALLAPALEACWEDCAQRYAALVLQAKASWGEGQTEVADYHTIDANTVELMRPRSIGIEHVALSALQQLNVEALLGQLGLNRTSRMAALGTLVARLACPGSDLASHRWLQQQSGLGELLSYDYERLALKRFYQAADELWQHKAALEQALFEQEQHLFALDEVITLYDLTNTYFEGQSQANEHAAFGRSKEKRSDCPLVTLALVLDSSGFIKHSEVLAGNISEPGTLEKLLGELNALAPTPTVVLDAGIATQANIDWLTAQGYRYVVVSRKRHREFDPDQAVTVHQTEQQQIRVQRQINPDTAEVELYCHSLQREAKERQINEQFAQRFENALHKLDDGLHKPRTVKRYDKVLQRLGRLKQQYARVAQHYTIDVEHDPDTQLATALQWSRSTSVEATHPGVYCLRTNQTDWDETTLWHTYTMLTDLEAVFRSLKSELGLRPVFHQTTERVSAHLFISVLAYHVVHTLRFQLRPIFT